jgi:hypothetical protein
MSSVAAIAEKEAGAKRWEGSVAGGKDVPRAGHPAAHGGGAPDWPDGYEHQSQMHTIHSGVDFLRAATMGGKKG